MKVQTQKSIDNLKIALKTVGGTLEDIVILRIYKMKIAEHDTAIISQVLIDNFGTEDPPASTWLSVDGLGNKEFMIEIEAQAII